MKPNTKEKIYLIIIVVLIAACAQFYFTYQYQPAHQVQVYYNQEHELNKEIIQLTREADKFVYFAIYTFTRNDIKDALLAAKYRGLNVKGITDKKQATELDIQKDIIKELREAGIPVLEQDHSYIMHLKTLITEKGYASGSYNWTGAGTNSNDEILELGHEESIRKQYEDTLKRVFEKYE